VDLAARLARLTGPKPALPRAVQAIAVTITTITLTTPLSLFVLPL
jgi:hypothetical protein